MMKHLISAVERPKCKSPWRIWMIMRIHSFYMIYQIVNYKLESGKHHQPRAINTYKVESRK